VRCVGLQKRIYGDVHISGYLFVRNPIGQVKDHSLEAQSMAQRSQDVRANNRIWYREHFALHSARNEGRQHLSGRTDCMVEEKMAKFWKPRCFGYYQAM
jgi:hypothetical protein